MAKKLETKELPVALTESEKLSRGLRMATIFTEIDVLDETLKAAKDVHKTAVGQLEAESRDLARQVRTGQEVRDVEIEVRKDWEKCTVDTFRLDTGESPNVTREQKRQRHHNLRAITGNIGSHARRIGATKVVPEHDEITYTRRLCTALNKAVKKKRSRRSTGAEKYRLRRVHYLAGLEG